MVGKHMREMECNSPKVFQEQATGAIPKAWAQVMWHGMTFSWSTHPHILLRFKKRGHSSIGGRSVQEFLIIFNLPHQILISSHF